mmetsp:Transcript_41468/g.83122  ORF Transcript_41468/g.83122 Transcript_41468/m.83122 type:complete len:287 (-) Transcript_41468:797-1657(-)
MRPGRLAKAAKSPARAARTLTSTIPCMTTARLRSTGGTRGMSTLSIRTITSPPISTSGDGASLSTSRRSLLVRTSMARSRGTSTTWRRVLAWHLRMTCSTAAAVSAARFATSGASLAPRSLASRSTSTRSIEGTRSARRRGYTPGASSCRRTSIIFPLRMPASTTATPSRRAATHPTARMSTQRSSACSSQEDALSRTSGASPTSTIPTTPRTCSPRRRSRRVMVCRTFCSPRHATTPSRRSASRSSRRVTPRSTPTLAARPGTKSLRRATPACSASSSRGGGLSS